MTKEKPLAILIPGKGDDVRFVEAATSSWQDKGVDTRIFSMGWNSIEEFEPKLARLLDLIDLLAKTRSVHTVGISAGGSAAMHSILERPESVKSGSNLFGRLRAGQHRLRSLNRMSKGSISFYQSVTSFEQNEPRLKPKERDRVLTLSSAIVDELVPADTSILDGARNERVYLPEHMLCIYWSLKYSNTVINHILDYSE